MTSNRIKHSEVAHRKARIVAAVIGCLSVAAMSYTVSTMHSSVVRAQEAAAMTRSVWDGVYTKEQADRGRAAYAKSCSRCHAASLAGDDEAPGLTGDQFFSDWGGLSVGDLFERINKSMPQDTPGSLSREIDADILAYVLSANNFPSGTIELPRQTEILAQIKIEANKPDKK